MVACRFDAFDVPAANTRRAMLVSLVRVFSALPTKLDHAVARAIC